MTDAQSINTVLFDFGGTLDSDGVAWKERIHAYYRAEGLTLTAEQFAPAFYAADDPLVGRLPPDTDLSTTMRRLTENLEGILAHPGDADAEGRNDLQRGRRVAARFLAESFDAFSRNRPVLEALSKRYRLGIVSNFYGNLEAVCREAGLAPLFSTMVDSHRVGAEKPAPAIFQIALDRLDATPEATLYVGDSLRRDRAGAEHIGMGFIWIAPPEAQAAEVRAVKGPLAHPAVSRLGDLAEILI
jgi:putative hydrolase of the HAD superfamily